MCVSSQRIRLQRDDNMFYWVVFTVLFTSSGLLGVIAMPQGREGGAINQSHRPLRIRPAPHRATFQVRRSRFDGSALC